MDYLSYCKLFTEFINLVRDINQGVIIKGDSRYGGNDSRRHTEIITYLSNIVSGRTTSEYFSRNDFIKLSRDEFSRLSDIEKSSLYRDLHRKIAQVYIMLEHYENRFDHHTNSGFSLKDQYMSLYMVHAVLGRSLCDIIPDENGEYFLNTHMALVLDNHRTTIRPHFGSRNTFSTNCRVITENALRLLKNYVPTEEKEKELFLKNVLSDFILFLDGSSIERFMHMNPLKKFLVHYSDEIELIDKVLESIADEDMDKERLLFVKSLSTILKPLNNDNKAQRDKAISILVRSFHSTQDMQPMLFTTEEILKMLKVLGYNEYTERDIEKIDTSIKQPTKRKDLIEYISDFMNLYPDDFSTIADINSLHGNDREFSSLIQIIQDIKNEHDENKKNELEEKLIYRCVGMGTEGEDCFFPSTEDDIDSSKQIIEFINSLDLGISIDEIDNIVIDAVENKELIRTDDKGDWAEGFLTIENPNKANIIKFVKEEFIRRGMELAETEDLIEIVQILELLYGKDENGIVEKIDERIDDAFKGEIEDEGKEGPSISQQLQNMALENKIDEFFDLLEKSIEE